MAERPDGLLDALGQLLQPRAHDLVVVAASRVHRDNGLAGPPQPLEFDALPAFGRACGQIVHASGNDAHGARDQFRRAGAFDAVKRHVGHFAVKSVG